MPFSQTILLGAISGLTIFLGMPLARLKAAKKEHLSFLNAIAIGVLFFLFVDVMTHATAPLEAALKGFDQERFELWRVMSTPVAKENTVSGK